MPSVCGWILRRIRSMIAMAVARSMVSRGFVSPTPVWVGGGGGGMGGGGGGVGPVHQHARGNRPPRCFVARLYSIWPRGKSDRASNPCASALAPAVPGCGRFAPFADAAMEVNTTLLCQRGEVGQQVCWNWKAAKPIGRLRNSVRAAVYLRPGDQILPSSGRSPAREVGFMKGPRIVRKVPVCPEPDGPRGSAWPTSPG